MGDDRNPIRQPFAVSTHGGTSRNWQLWAPDPVERPRPSLPLLLALYYAWLYCDGMYAPDVGWPAASPALAPALGCGWQASMLVVMFLEGSFSALSFTSR